MTISQPKLSEKMRLLIGVTLFITLLPLLGLTKQKLDTKRLESRASELQSYYLPQKEALGALAFGYNELAADILWVKTIAYFADHFTTDRNYKNLKRYLLAITHLNPHFYSVYRFGSSMMMSEPTQENIRNAISLLEKAHRYFPKNHEIPQRLGIYYMTDLKSKDQEIQKQYKLKGAEWINRAILLGAKTYWLPSLAAQVFDENGKRQVAIQRLKELYLVAQDEKTKLSIVRKLRKLNAEDWGARLAKEKEETKRAQKEAGLDFISEDLFLLIKK